MATTLKLRLRENNDETIVLYALTNGAPRNITGRTLEFYIKADANELDADSDIFSTENGYITVTNGVAGVAEVSIPREFLDPSKTFWRYDIVDGNTRHTHIYGPLEVVNI